MVHPLTLWRWRSRSASTDKPVGTVETATDADLLIAGRTGDQNALSLLFTRHEAMLYRLCLGFTGQASDAEDMVQDVILRALAALQRPGGFRGDSSVQTWLYRIAVRRCLEHRRQKRPGSLDSLSVFPDSGLGPEQLTVNRQTIREALNSLPPGQRLVLVLREQEQQSAAEIAAVLGWSEKKVNNELYKARRALAAWRERAGL